MAEGHEFKTTFTTCYGTYEWLVLPLSLTNALSTFQKLMNSIFSDMLDESLLVYLDNLLVFSADIELHYDDIHKTLEQLCENKLKAKGSKCEFAVPKVEYLGHIVENRTVAMDPEKNSCSSRLASTYISKATLIIFRFC